MSGNNKKLHQNQLQSLESLSNPASNSRYASNPNSALMGAGGSHSFQNTKSFNSNSSNVGNYKLKSSLIEGSSQQNAKKKGSTGPSNRQSVDMNSVNSINLNHSQVNLQRQVSG